MPRNGLCDYLRTLVGRAVVEKYNFVIGKNSVSQYFLYIRQYIFPIIETAPKQKFSVAYRLFFVGCICANFSVLALYNSSNEQLAIRCVALSGCLETTIIDLSSTIGPRYTALGKFQHHGAFYHDRAIRQINNSLFELLQRIIVSFPKHQLYAELVAKRHFADSLSHTAETDGIGQR